MNKKVAIALLSLGLLSATAARADDSLWGAVIGGGTGALIGSSIGGRNGAVVGGALGAAAGMAIASDRPQARVAYGPGPVYVGRPVVVETVPVRYEREGWEAHQHWAHERWERERHAHEHGHDRDWDHRDHHHG